MILFVSELLLAIGATHIEAFGDSLLLVEHISLDFVCFDESLNIYLDKCIDIISITDCFSIAHIFRHDIEEQMSWHSKHPAIMLIMVYCSRAYDEFANIGEAESEPTISATNGNFICRRRQDCGKFTICYLQDSSKRVDTMI